MNMPLLSFPPTSGILSRLLILLSALLFATPAAYAGSVKVAVAANFIAPMEQIAAAFNKETGHTALLSSGASGAFYAQIKNGAPYEVMLSADTKIPNLLAKDQQAVAESEFTYATGHLVLWSADPGKVDTEGKVLQTGSFRHLAIANPDTAPYGKAATETLAALKLLETLKPKLITGENIGQTYQFVRTGNAEIGFVALSQVYLNGSIAQGSAWRVPTSLHTPLRQNAILLNKGRANPAASALLDFLKGPQAHAIISAYGYSP